MNATTIVAIIVAIISPAGVAAGVLLQGRIQSSLNRQQFAQQLEREEIAHRRQVAENRRTEIKAKYEQLLITAQLFNKEYSKLWRAYLHGETMDATALLDSAGADVFGAATAALSAEQGTEDISKLADAYVVQAALYISEFRNPRTAESTALAQQHQLELDASYHQFVAAVRDILAALDRQVDR